MSENELKAKIAKLEDDLRYYQTKSSNNEQAYVNYMNENRDLKHKNKSLLKELMDLHLDLVDTGSVGDGILRLAGILNDAGFVYNRKGEWSKED